MIPAASRALDNMRWAIYQGACSMPVQAAWCGRIRKRLHYELPTVAREKDYTINLTSSPVYQIHMSTLNVDVTKPLLC